MCALIPVLAVRNLAAGGWRGSLQWFRKMLAMQIWRPVFDPHVKRLGVVVYSSNLSTGEETGGSLGITGWIA